MKKITLLTLIIFFLLFIPDCTNKKQTEHDISSGALRKEVFALVSSAENSTLDYSKQYSYIEDIHEGRGYTAGIIGFTSKNGDLLDVIRYYTRFNPHNSLKKYIPALEQVKSTASHKELGSNFVKEWKKVGNTSKMIQAKNHILNKQYMDSDSFGEIRKAALAKAKAQSQGGSETHYLNTFLKVRATVMQKEEAHQDLSRIKAQRKFIKEKK